MKVKKRDTNKPTYGPAVKPGDRKPNGQFAPGNSNAWKPGQCPNPTGRRGPAQLSTAFKLHLNQTCDHPDLNPDNNPDMTWAVIIARAMVLQAAVGNVKAAKEIREATEGNTVNVRPLYRDALKGLGIDPDWAMEQVESIVEEMFGDTDGSTNVEK